MRGSRLPVQFTTQYPSCQFVISAGSQSKKVREATAVSYSAGQDRGAYLSWQLFKFKAQHGVHNFLNTAWEPAAKPSRRKTKRRRSEIGSKRAKGFCRLM